MNEYSIMFDKIIKQYTNEELEQICKTLNKSYNIYDSEEHRWAQLQYVLSKTPEEDITDLRNTQLSNQVINDLILKFYPCERVVKYYLIKKLQSLSNNIVAFEKDANNYDTLFHGRYPSGRIGADNDGPVLPQRTMQPSNEACMQPAGRT